MKKNAVYPGTFDPVTYGHIDIIERALKIFDEVIVAVAYNPNKNPLFTVGERVEMLKQITKNMRGVKVENFDGLLMDYVRRKSVSVVIRGLRAVSDFEYEFQMALTNRKLNNEVETLFLMPGEAYTYLDSRMVKEVVGLGGRVSEFVPEIVEKRLKEKLPRKVITNSNPVGT
jgi:pantetheine-phosphate adenylyltransferase